MKIKKYLTLLITVLLVFMFLYTFKINFDLNRSLNIINLSITFIVLILWLFAGYLLLIRNIFNSPEKEKNGIVLAMVMIGIVFFYYNPFPNPENYFVEIPRLTYFILTIISFIVLLIAFWGENIISFILALFIPFTVQSFLVNILHNAAYTKYNLYIVLVFIAIAYGLSYFKRE